jgi:hypothetical protein
MKKEIIPVQQVAQALRFVRGERVLLDFDLARLYGVTTRNLNKAVRRNRERFQRTSCLNSPARRQNL